MVQEAADADITTPRSRTEAAFAEGGSAYDEGRRRVGATEEEEELAQGCSSWAPMYAHGEADDDGGGGGGDGGRAAGNTTSSAPSTPGEPDEHKYIHGRRQTNRVVTSTNAPKASGVCGRAKY